MDQSRSITKFPRVPGNLETVVKPEELVDIVEMTPLTLQDRRFYNLLLGNAWNNIFKQTEHTIARKELTKHIDSNNQDIEASLRRLMSAIVVIKTKNEYGEPETRQVQLLGPNSVPKRGREIKYDFPDKLVSIIQKTQIFARLHTQVMFALSSKYSLALYEFLQKRKNLKHVTSETLTVEEVRGMLGVGNKLKQFGHLNDKAIQPSCKEVSYLSDHTITAELIKTGNKVTHVKFEWTQKQDVGSQIAAVEELERSKVGRKARMNEAIPEEEVTQKGDSNSIQRIDEGTTLEFGPSSIADVLTNTALGSILSQESDSLFNEDLPELPVTPPIMDIPIPQSAIDQVKKIARAAPTDWDPYAIIEEFKEWTMGKQPPNDIAAACVGFAKKKIKHRPGEYVPKK